MKLKTIEKMVYDVLKSNPKTRDNDMELYYIVSKEFFYLTHGQAMLLFEDVMRNYKALGIPCFESVRRTRQKIQAAYPELGCSPDVRRARHRNQKAYVDYALDKEGN